MWRTCVCPSRTESRLLLPCQFCLLSYVISSVNVLDLSVGANANLTGSSFTITFSKMIYVTKRVSNLEQSDVWNLVHRCIVFSGRSSLWTRKSYISSCFLKLVFGLYQWLFHWYLVLPWYMIYWAIMITHISKVSAFEQITRPSFRKVVIQEKRT